MILAKTAPGRTLDDQAILSLRAAAQKAMPTVEIWRASVDDPLDDAFIDSQTLRDEIADGKIELRDFMAYCESRHIDAYDENRDIVPKSAQSFLISLWGQGVFGVAIPLDEAVAREAFARLIRFAEESQLHLVSMVAGGGIIDLEEPGALPPMWHGWISARAPIVRAPAAEPDAAADNAR
jgi:hypothetical protein